MSFARRWKRIRPTNLWGRGVTAASLAFTQVGVGSNPSGPTENKHWWSSGKTPHS